MTQACAQPGGNLPPLTTDDLGFAADGADDHTWRKLLRGRPFTFRLLRDRADFLAVEELQRHVFGVDDRDRAAASALVVVPETGGMVIGAYPDDEAALAGFLVAWGGYVEGRPRLVSDMLGVRPPLRGSGLGAALKVLQAALAGTRGFEDIVWTVDPLRAANARLNFEKLGAYADRYEEDRYGAAYGAGLYGGLPTDRLHVTWPITSRHVRDRLLGRTRPLTRADVAGVPRFDPTSPPADRVLVPFPADVDALLAHDPAVVRQWRQTLRATLPAAFAAGFAITGFVPDIVAGDNVSAYLLTRRHASVSSLRIEKGGWAVRANR